MFLGLNSFISAGGYIAAGGIFPDELLLWMGATCFGVSRATSGSGSFTGATGGGGYTTGGATGAALGGSAGVALAAGGFDSGSGFAAAAGAAGAAGGAEGGCCGIGVFAGGVAPVCFGPDGAATLVDLELPQPIFKTIN